MNLSGFRLRRFMFCQSILLALATSPLFATPPQATPVERIRVPEGFQVELLYSVPLQEKGSWVSMTHDPQGRLIVSDQAGPLYRVTPGEHPEDTQVEQLEVRIGNAQGLLYTAESLYVMVNGKVAEGSGLYRLRDTNGDDQFDEVEFLKSIPGLGEHGPHAVVLGPDGESLYICAGNHTKLPEVQSSRVPRNWDEDHLLPRLWDAGGHAVGMLAPGGWICRTDLDGKDLELVSSGFRNHYDLAFNPDGELFTFDSDMEWDIGTPWYRPTRVCHVTSGSEFGWRSGTGKWPTYYPDSLPATVDIGPGSPTGVAFGTGAKFPAKYQRALFACDWSFGILYTVDLKPRGSTYVGEAEHFAVGTPLPLTAILVNAADGAMYFTTGGRSTQSGLYRVTYVGDESTEPAKRDSNSHDSVRQLRKQLEAFHGAEDPDAVSVAWPNLSHSDRFIRFAARVAIEHQPVDTWQDRAFSEEEPNALILAMIALARCGDESLQLDVLQSLNHLDWEKLSEDQQLALLRAYGLAFIRLGAPTDELRLEVLNKLDGHYPADSRLLNEELSQLLIYLEAPEVVSRTLGLLVSAASQEEQIHYILALHSLKSGWTLEQREEYFQWFQRSDRLHGGNSFSRFLSNIRLEAVELLSEEEKVALSDVLSRERVETLVTEEVEPRPFVKKWELADLVPSDEEMVGRDVRRGREIFAAASCFQCHRFKGEGGIIGPDLTAAGHRFDDRYLIESLIDPDKVVSDQYQATVFHLDSGKTVVGKIANLNDDKLMIITDMLQPSNLTTVRTSEIDEQYPSEVSMMPSGLLDTFHRDEILDLLAFLKSGERADSGAAAE